MLNSPFCTTSSTVFAAQDPCPMASHSLATEHPELQHLAHIALESTRSSLHTSVPSTVTWNNQAKGGKSRNLASSFQERSFSKSPTFFFSPQAL